MLSTAERLFWKLGPVNGRTPTSTVLPATLTEPLAHPLPAPPLAGAAGANCFSTFRFVALTPGNPVKVAYPFVVGVQTPPPTSAACPIGLYSKFEKKNSLLRRMGPPICPPKRLLSKRGFSVFPARTTETSVAFRSLFWKYS